jgi:serine/threonine-protein kinase RsbW
MEIKMVLDLPRDAVSVPVCRQVLDSCLNTLGVAPNTRSDIALALTEACANVIQHAGPGEEYKVLVSAKDRRCAIEVVNSGTGDGDGDTRRDGERLDGLIPADDPVSGVAEHGRGLEIIDAVADNVQLTGGRRQGTTLHFEKTLEWLPGSAGQHLIDAVDGA